MISIQAIKCKQKSNASTTFSTVNIVLGDVCDENRYEFICVYNINSIAGGIINKVGNGSVVLFNRFVYTPSYRFMYVTKYAQQIHITCTEYIYITCMIRAQM